MPFDFAVIRQSFFNADLVRKKVEAGKRKAISRQLGFIRIEARQSMRRRKKSSPAGQPPSAHAGNLKTIYYAYDSASGSGVVGPIPFSAKRIGASIVPRLLEKGGEVTVGGRRRRYRGNPYMAPAEEKMRSKFSDSFLNVV